MIPIEIRNSVRLLRAQGQSLREISRLLKLSRNAVRRILREGERASPPSLPCNAATLARLADAFRRAGGNGVRVQELLVSEIGLNVPYSTLTRWIWEAELRDLPKRSGEYHQGPGEEMQHDTSPQRVVLAEKAVKAQCAGLTLAFSRRLVLPILASKRNTSCSRPHASMMAAALFVSSTIPACLWWPAPDRMR
jgi:hypothetical protein